jgi:heat shock protein HslJ
MKKIIALIILAVFSFSMKAQNKQVVVSVAYESFSRRSRTEIIVTRDSAIVKTRDDAKYILMAPGQWQKITRALQKVKLSSVPSYKAPTKAREYDGAAHSKLAITTATKKYESQYFDSGQPMKPLQLLNDEIEAIRSAVEKNGTAYGEPIKQAIQK